MAVLVLDYMGCFTYSMVRCAPATEKIFFSIFFVHFFRVRVVRDRWSALVCVESENEH